MKSKNFIKLIALALVMSLMLGYAAVLTSVASTDDGTQAAAAEPTDENVLQVLLNRDFEDGKTPQNGGTLSSSAASEAIEVKKTGSNTYLRFTSQGAHDYIYYTVGNYAPASGSVVMKMDIMVEKAGVAVSGMLQLNPNVRGSSSDVYQLANIRSYSGKSHLTPLSNGVSAYSQYPMTAWKWYTLTIVWSYESKESVTCTVFNDAGKTATYLDTTASGAAGCTDVRPGQVRVGTTASATGSWCLDNVVIYTTRNTDAEEAAGYHVSDADRGSLYNPNGDPYIDQKLFEDSAYMKVGVNRALNLGNSTVDLTEAPFTSKGTVYIPTSALSAIGVTASSNIQTVEGIECVAIGDINAATGEKYYSLYSSMGLIGITDNPSLSFEGLGIELIPTMQKFIFDGITSELKNANAFSVSDMTSLSHPYIYADQDKFDSLAKVYSDRSDATLASYLDYQVTQAANIYKSYATTSSSTYTGLKAGINKIPYTNAYGYDVGGRLNESASHNTRLQTLAFGYQITKNENYARLAYDYAIAMGQWEHWGPGHFLNCADAASPYAIAYDWLYSIWVELGLDVSKIEEIIFTHAILPAYYSAHDNGCPWYDPVVSSGWNFHTRNNNWNAVCSAGVTMASLALVGKTTSAVGTMLDITVDGVYKPDTPSYAGTTGTITRKDGKSFTTNQSDMQTYRDYCEYLVNVCLYSLPMYGMEQYAPDGSYIESNGYWSYGTNNFFELTAALTSATGTDYGLLDTWGIDRTAYFALNTQSGDYKGWNYHDSDSTGAQDTSWFIYLGTEDGLGDKALAGIRKRILDNATNVKPAMYDALYYMSDEEIGTFELPDIQYYMEGIDGYVIRDSWDKESIYAGIMGNTNNLGHGQIDSGSFVYHNGGTIWFCDVGTENYNSYGFWGSGTRYTYYKMNAEGNNALILTSRQQSIPYGQSLNGFGAMTSTYDNEHGAYAIIDNTTAYGGYASSAYRGMLFTNDRKTLVIQDEVTFVNPESVAWIGHTEQEIVISVDGRTAYMYDGTNVLKVTLIDKNGLGLKFEVTDTYDFLLDCTVGPNYSTDHGGVAEDNRSSYKRLIIRADNVTNLDLAVVIEEVAIGVSTNELGYEWCDMDEWVPTSDGRAANTTLGRFDFDGAEYGSVKTEGDAYVTVEAIGENNAAQIAGGKVSLLANASNVEYGSLGRGVLTAELDIRPGDVTGGTIGIYANGGTLVSVGISELGTAGKSGWIRCTVIMDLDSSTALVYADGALVRKSGYTSASLENLALAFDLGDGEAIAIDNAIIRCFTEEYTGLDSVIVGEALDTWTDRTADIRTLAGTLKVATVTTGSTTIDVYSFDELETKIKSGCTVELHASNYGDAISINVPCTVITNGYNIGATSENYIARADGGKLIYESGEITVKWVIDGQVISETYTGSVTATYKGITGSTIYEQDNGNGTYSYYTLSGWSKTKGGATLAERDMTVTTENHTFYAAKCAFDGLFVTVRGDTVRGYYDPADLFRSYIYNGTYDRLSLTADVAYDSTGISDSAGITSNFVLYLNGYSITYTSSDTSDHMYTIDANYASLTVYGPGELINTAASSNLIYHNKGETYVEGVTFTTSRAVTDTRQGRGHYKNCTVNMTSTSQAFGALNRNNATTTESLMPYLLIDGCTINIPKATSSTAAFVVQSNATVELNGGTVVNMGSTESYLFSLVNSSVSSTSYDYANGYKYMAALIGSVYHNCENLYKNTTNDSSGKTYEMGDSLRYCEGAMFTSVPGNDVKVIDGLIIARQANSTYPYVVAKSADCAKVTFVLGTASVTEYWVGGATPTADSDAVRAAENKNPAASGKRYYFNTEVVSAGTEYTFTASEVTAFGIMGSMTMHTGFDFNVYIPANVNGVTFIGFTLNGKYTAAGDATVIDVDGMNYYKISELALAPHTCAKSLPLEISIECDGNKISITSTVSVLDYAKEIFEDENQPEEVKMLVANILKYMDASYIYAGKSGTDDYQALKLVYDKYKSYSTVSVVMRDSAKMTAVADGISSAALILSNDPIYRFTFNKSYTGTVTFRYYENSKEQTLTLNIVNGLHDGKSYINISRDPHELIGGVTITTKGGSATYNLAIYYHNTAKELGATMNIMNALYAYCECARIYYESVTN